MDGACLTAHILDLSTGRPEPDMRVCLLRHGQGELDSVFEMYSNADGRFEQPFLLCKDARPGRYTLSFDVNGPFLRSVPVEFQILETDRHHHVPLVLSPFGFSTYRGAPPHRAPQSGALTESVPLTMPTGSAAAPGSLGAGITVHVIDISQGMGAGGMRVELIAPSGGPLRSLVTTAEGRTAEWLADSGSLETGTYELRFDFETYFNGAETRPFFTCARVRFRVNDPTEHHHIPLLAAPWGYSCYRGS